MSMSDCTSEIRRLRGVAAVLADSHEYLTTTDDLVCTTNMRVECDFTESFNIVAIMYVYVNDTKHVAFPFRREDCAKISITNAYKSDKFMSLTVGGGTIDNIYRIELSCSYNDRYAITIYSENEYAQIPTFGLVRKEYALGIISRLINDRGINYIIGVR